MKRIAAFALWALVTYVVAFEALVLIIAALPLPMTVQERLGAFVTYNKVIFSPGRGEWTDVVTYLAITITVVFHFGRLLRRVWIRRRQRITAGQLGSAKGIAEG